MKKYLFKNPHNGFQNTYQPFECDRSITQEKAEQMIRSICPFAGRTGGSLGHLLEAMDKLNWKFKEYKYVYYKPEENNDRCVIGDKDHWDIDPLPDCMYSWDVIEGISGNY